MRTFSIYKLNRLYRTLYYAYLFNCHVYHSEPNADISCSSYNLLYNNDNTMHANNINNKRAQRIMYSGVGTHNTCNTCMYYMYYVSLLPNVS